MLDFEKESELKASLKDPSLDIVQKQEANESLVAVTNNKLRDTIQSLSKKLTDNKETKNDETYKIPVEDIKESKYMNKTSSDMENASNGALNVLITAEISDHQASKEENKTEVLLNSDLNEIKDCRLKKWFLVCKEFNILKDEDIFAN